MPTPESEKKREKPAQVHIRISETAKSLLEKLGDKYGLNTTHAVEYCIRQTARAEGLWDIDGKGAKKAR